MFKSIVSVAVLALLATAVPTFSIQPTAEQQLQNQFISWMEQHNIEFESVEMLQRLNTFKQNLVRIEQHNAEADAGKHSFRLGLNQFAAMSNEEYRTTVLGLKKRSPNNFASATFEPKRSVAAPASVDWRTHSPPVVTGVKNQGQCGSCWSFSAVGAMEGAFALATSQLVSFSEQELVDCVNGGADTCTAGGEMHDGYLEVQAAGGIEREDAYPYTGTSGNKCGNDESKFVKGAQFSGYTNVTSGDEAAMAAALSVVPTISVGIDASSFWFQLYMGGVYDDSSCKNQWDQLDHGVLAVGYGHDDSSNKDFYIIKNSWGASWGEKGFIRMVRNKNNQCGVATDATFPQIKQ